MNDYNNKDNLTEQPKVKGGNFTEVDCKNKLTPESMVYIEQNMDETVESSTIRKDVLNENQIDLDTTSRIIRDTESGKRGFRGILCSIFGTKRHASNEEVIHKGQSKEKGKYRKSEIISELKRAIISLEEDISAISEQIFEVENKSSYELIQQKRLQDETNKLAAGHEKSNRTLQTIVHDLSLLEKEVSAIKVAVDTQYSEQLKMKTEIRNIEKHVKELEQENRISHNFMFEIMGCQDDETRKKAVLRELEMFRHSSYSMQMVENIYEGMKRCDNYDQIRFKIDDLSDVIKEFKRRTKMKKVEG